MHLGIGSPRWRVGFGIILVSLLCCTALTNAQQKRPLYLVPASGSPPSRHTVDLHKELFAAVIGDKFGTIKKLLAAGADINVIEDYSKTHTPLTYAAESGDVAMTKFLLSYGADPNGQGVKLSPLFWTVSNGETECVRLLLRAGADPNRACVDADRPIDFAAEEGDIATVKLLIWRMPHLSRLQARQYLAQTANVSLSKAVSSGSLAEVKALVQAGANVNYGESNDEYGVGSPLMRATSRGNMPLLKFLLAHGAQVNQRDSEGRTALMYTGQTDMYYSCVMPDSAKLPISPLVEPTRILLQHGAKVGLRDHNGMTALMYAAQGNWRATQLLLAHGAQVNVRDGDGRTALHWAAAIRDPQSLRLLLRHGALINAQDGGGATALMLASVQPDGPVTSTQRRARLDALNLLLRSGANPRLKDKNGDTSATYSRMEDADFVTAN